MGATAQEAYCTLLMSDSYLPGAMVLAHSLRDNGTKKELAVLVTLESLKRTTIDELNTVYDHVIPVDRIVNRAPANLYLMNRPDLASTFTKIALWKQTQYTRIVYIDADIVALRAPDELFALESHFAATPDVGWPDCFNSGVLVLSPNMGDYYALLALAERGISFDGADQGLLNMHFRNWDRLSFAYNCTPSGHYQYVPAYRHFQSTISMVHYIGHDKPWKMERIGSGATSVYEELLGRWWAVYERHYRASAQLSISGRKEPTSRNVQYYVYGEDATDHAFSTLGPTIIVTEPPPSEIGPTELPMTEQSEIVERLEQGEGAHVPKIEQRRFSAPMADWDPARQAPPANSRPEAANFPKDTYSMSEDKNLFQAPKSYPEPPKNMWYEIPKSPSADERPKPIFPWEENQPKPTRVFAEDIPPSPEPIPSISTDEETGAEESSPITPLAQITSPEPFSFYSMTNAWDEVPEIERYVSALAQSRRPKVEVLVNNDPTGGDVLSPTAEEGPPKRRPSMKLTDFPTEIERPSLPVTPAPVRRPSFWGDEWNAGSELPGAEGVPKQEEWDPLAKLQELQRRQSEVLAQGPISPPRPIPDRALMERAVLLPTSEETEAPLTSVVLSSGLESMTRPEFQDMDFTRRNVGRSGEDEGVFSPIE